MKNKKGEYDDLESAKDLALSSYRSFDGGKNSEDLKKAIVIWEQAYTESDVDDKKARINQKVTSLVLLNLVHASLILQNPEAAQTYLNALDKIKSPYKISVLIPALREQIGDVKERVEAVR